MKTILTVEINKAEFAAASALDRIRMIDAIYDARAIHLSSMQKTAGVLMHMIYRAGAQANIVFIDTQLHFPETLAIRDQFQEKYGLNITTVQPDLTPLEQNKWFSAELHRYVDGQPLCCHLRKELPLFQAVKRFQAKALITGLMRAEGNGRTDVPAISRDPSIKCAVFNPLFDWNSDRLESYIREYDLPVHPLYAQSYASIGCAVCTTPIKPGEDSRAGRWRHLRASNGNRPIYCNINYSDKINPSKINT